MNKTNAMSESPIWFTNHVFKGLVQQLGDAILSRGEDDTTMRIEYVPTGQVFRVSVEEVPICVETAVHIMGALQDHPIPGQTDKLRINTDGDIELRVWGKKIFLAVGIDPGDDDDHH